MFESMEANAKSRNEKSKVGCRIGGWKQSPAPRNQLLQLKS
jgi:hypothetical protein